MNLAFYLIDCRISGKQAVLREAVATTLAGGVSGAIAGATFGAFAAGGALAQSTLLTKIVVQTGSNILADVAETAVDMSVNNLLGNSQGNMESFGMGLWSGTRDLLRGSVDVVEYIDSWAVREAYRGHSCIPIFLAQATLSENLITGEILAVPTSLRGSTALLMAVLSFASTMR